MIGMAAKFRSPGTLLLVTACRDWGVLAVCRAFAIAGARKKSCKIEPIIARKAKSFVELSIVHSSRLFFPACIASG
jgi:hypothetical protein